jgi:hypothetical protein
MSAVCGAILTRPNPAAEALAIDGSPDDDRSTALAISEKWLFRLKRKPLVIGCIALAARIFGRWLLLNANVELTSGALIPIGSAN